jgi:hypothetical protein
LYYELESADVTSELLFEKMDTEWKNAVDKTVSVNSSQSEISSFVQQLDLCCFDLKNLKEKLEASSQNRVHLVSLLKDMLEKQEAIMAKNKDRLSECATILSKAEKSREEASKLITTSDAKYTPHTPTDSPSSQPSTPVLPSVDLEYTIDPTEAEFTMKKQKTEPDPILSAPPSSNLLGLPHLPLHQFSNPMMGLNPLQLQNIAHLIQNPNDPNAALLSAALSNLLMPPPQ